MAKFLFTLYPGDKEQSRVPEGPSIRTALEVELLNGSDRSESMESSLPAAGSNLSVMLNSKCLLQRCGVTYSVILVVKN